MNHPVGLEAIRAFLADTYVGVPGTRLRREDEKKCRELVGLLAEIAGASARVGRGANPLRIVDAAAGKGYVGLSAAVLLSPVLRRDVRVTFIEREAGRVEAICRACRAAGLGDGTVDIRCSDVADGRSWPQEPDLVVALHACGDATDRTLEAATRARAKCILVIPCCVASWLPSASRASALAEQLGLPRQAEVRRRYVEAHVLSERLWALEAAGWQTEAVPFVASAVTPYNVVLRARRVGEPHRMRDAAGRLERLRQPFRT